MHEYKYSTKNFKFIIKWNLNKSLVHAWTSLLPMEELFKVFVQEDQINVLFIHAQLKLKFFLI